MELNPLRRATQIILFTVNKDEMEAKSESNFTIDTRCCYSHQDNVSFHRKLGPIRMALAVVCIL